jgi:POT family proton-dependent oligopeptide transporter
MSNSKYRSAPVASTKMPPGIPYIISNELAERFSFYGMKAILTVFMTKYLLNNSGELAPMTEENAKTWYHLFTSAVYFTPLFGALLADIFLGKYRTILFLSVVYVFGHFALALDETRLGLAVGLGLIAVGAGGIKPCVSAHVGDQFGKTNQHLITKVFSWFYFSINLGAAASSMLIPVLLEKYGPQVAFGVPGVLMLVATIAFWMGRNKFVHVPPGGVEFLKETFSKEGLGAMAKLAVVFAFVAMFWALFDQTGSAWVLQAQHMDRNFMGIEWLESQIQAANPIMIMALIPVFAYGIYPLAGKVVKVTPTRKMAAGMVLTAGSFAISAMIEKWIVAGGTPNIVWQLLAYLVLTAGEVMVSITALEFAYTQAPKRMKSFIMALFLLSVSLGNLFTAWVNFFIQNDDGSSKLAGASYYWFFAAVMLGTALLFMVYSLFYKEKTYVQDEVADSTATGKSVG